MGLARRAARRFDAGVGPVELPEKIFSATVEASATAWEGRVARARFRNFGAGSLPVPKQLSGRRPKLPRQPWQTRAVARARSVILALGAGPSGFPKKISPGDGQSFCDSFPRARFRRFGAGGWPDGLPETSFRATQSGGILDGQWPQWPFYQPEADRWPDISGQAEPFLSRACRIATLSRPASRSGRFVEGRVARARFRNFGAGSWPVASRNNFPGDGRSFRDSHGKPRRSRALRCSGAGGWSVGLPETIFPTASLALASVVLALGGGRTGFPKRAMKAEGSWTASGRNGRFINQKRTSGQISKFGPRPISYCPV